jgi:hypothetical protein
MVGYDELYPAKFCDALHDINSNANKKRLWVFCHWHVQFQSRWTGVRCDGYVFDFKISFSADCYKAKQPFSVYLQMDKNSVSIHFDGAIGIQSMADSEDARLLRSALQQNLNQKRHQIVETNWLERTVKERADSIFADIVARMKTAYITEYIYHSAFAGRSSINHQALHLVSDRINETGLCRAHYCGDGCTIQIRYFGAPWADQP